MDVLGSSQTLASYEGVMNFLDIKKEEQLDLAERFFWALSLASNPNSDILGKLFTKYKKSENLPTKLNETFLLTIASMSHRYSSSPNLQTDTVSD